MLLWCKSTARTHKHQYHQLLLQYTTLQAQNKDLSSLLTSEEMAQSAGHWISMLGLVEHPGDEDGELLANSTSTSDLVIQATFLSPSRQRLVWSRKASSRNVQHHQLPISFRSVIPDSLLSILIVKLDQNDFSVGQDLQVLKLCSFSAGGAARVASFCKIISLNLLGTLNRKFCFHNQEISTEKSLSTTEAPSSITIRKRPWLPPPFREFLE